MQTSQTIFFLGAGVPQGPVALMVLEPWDGRRRLAGVGWDSLRFGVQQISRANSQQGLEGEPSVAPMNVDPCLTLAQLRSGALFYLFLGKGSPLKSTNQKRMPPFFPWPLGI